MSSFGLNNRYVDLQQGGGTDAEDATSGPMSFLNALEDVVLTVRADGTILGANAATSVVFGHSPADLQGRNLAELLPHWTSQLSLESDSDYAAAFRTPHVARHASGEEFITRMTLLPTESGLMCIIRATESHGSVHVSRPSSRSSKVVTLSFQLPNGTLDWSAEAAILFGYPSLAPPPKWSDFRDRILGDQDEWFQESLAELNDGSEEVEFEFRFRRPGGDTIWVKTWSHVETIGDDTVIRVSAIETTLMWEARAALSETSQFYRAALQASLDCFFLLDAIEDEAGAIMDFKVLEINRQTEAMLHLAADDVVGKPLSHVLRSDLYQVLFERYRAAIDQRQPIQEQVCVPVANGRPIWIQHQLVPVGRGVAVKSRDISADKTRERELRLTQFAVDNAAEAMWIIAEDGQLLEVNETFLNRLGIAKEAIADMKIWDVNTYHTPRSWPGHVKRLRDEQKMTFMATLRRADGTEMPVEVATGLFEFESQTYVCSFARDITARLEAAAKEAELNQRLESAYDATLQGWSRALDMRDDETEFHSSRVMTETVRLAELMGVSRADLVHIRRGSLLHDIGKMAIPDEILHKPGALSPEEWVVMRQHPVFAYDMLKPIEYLAEAIDIPYCHHEKWDGTGYPRGLKGEEIPLAARIFAIIDVYDALRSERRYRPAWPKDKVMEHIRGQVGTHFDPVVAEAFFAMHETPVLGMAETSGLARKANPHVG